MRRLRRFLPFLLLLSTVAVARAEDPPQGGAKPPSPELTLERLFDGGEAITTPVPRWSWRPQHLELVRMDTEHAPKPKDGGKQPAPRRRLLARDAETGTVRPLVDWSALEAFVPGKGVGMRGIGRAGPPKYRFSKDGKALCAVVKGDLVWVELEHERPWRRLTQTTSPLSDLRVSPDGRHVSFARSNDLWVVPTVSGGPRRLTQGGSEVLRNSSLDWVYPEEFSFDTGAWWSPDGARIAWLQLDQRRVPRHHLPNMQGVRGEGRRMRYPRAGEANPVARVGVVSVEGEARTTWLDLDDAEYVVRVAWTPDASRVLVVTMDRKQQHLRLLSCDPDDGSSVPLLEEKSAQWIAAPPAPEFPVGHPHAFIWRSDDGGARQFWLCRTDAEYVTVEQQEAITPAGMSARRLHHVDLDAMRALYEATPHGSTVTSVFAGWGEESAHADLVEDPEMSTEAQVDDSGRLALVTWSDPVTPPRTELRRVAGGKRIALIGDARSPATEVIEPARYEELSIDADGGGRILMRLWSPAELEPGRRYPMIVHVYAGPGSRTIQRQWGRGPYLQTFLTRKGYCVLQVDGRGTGGQGPAFERSVYGSLGIKELEDQAAGAVHVAEREYIDADRIGIWGWSFGGTMTCNALTRKCEVFKVGVAVAPVTDWRLYDTIYTERYMGLPQENEQGYKDTAAVHHAKTMGGKLLLLHGMGDDNVHAQNAFRMAEALLREKKTTAFSLMVYPWRGHGIQGVSIDVFTRLVDWFDTHL